MINDGILSRLANITTVQSNIQRIFGYGRGVISKDRLHKLQAKSNALDLEFVDLLLEVNLTGDKAQEEVDIAAKVQLAKQKLKRANIKTVQQTDGAVVVSPPVDVPEHVKKTTKKTVRKTKTKNAKSVKE